MGRWPGLRWVAPLGLKPLAWAALDRPFGARLPTPRDSALPGFDAGRQLVGVGLALPGVAYGVTLLCQYLT